MDKVIFSDNGFWEYDRFSLEEREDGVWYEDLEVDNEFKLEGNLNEIVEEGKEKGYFFKVGKVFYFDWDKEDEMMDWLEGR